MNNQLNQKIVISKVEACTGCRICELICSLRNNKTGINPLKSNIRILDNHKNGIYVPVSCQFCNQANCIESCPSSAITRSSQTAIISINREKCTGCGICVQECDSKVIFINEKDNIAVACDLCKGDPQCVKYCMPEAIIFHKNNGISFNKK